MLMLRQGDIVLTHGEGFISKAIRFFERAPKESLSEVNHAGIIVNDGTIETAFLVEALTQVEKHSLANAYSGADTKIEIWRSLNISSEDLDIICQKANAYVGNKYSYLKIVANFGDWLLTRFCNVFIRRIRDVYFFRWLAQLDNRPICSFVVAKAYAQAGYWFGVAAEQATPDDIDDFVRINEGKRYTCVMRMDYLK